MMERIVLPSAEADRQTGCARNEDREEGLVIRPLAVEDDIAGITTLLHDAYAPLAAVGLRYMASHQDVGTTVKRLGAGYPYVAEMSGRVVATATLYPPSTDSPCEWYRQPGVYRLGQFAVAPQFQRQEIGLRLFRRLEEHARKEGAREIALDTAEGAARLRGWYEQLGFRFIQLVDWDDTNYVSVVLSKELACEGEISATTLLA